MNRTNRFYAVVKIVKNPIRIKVNNKIPLAILDVGLSQYRKKMRKIKPITFIYLIFWGKLIDRLENSYKINGYILIEGFLRLRKENPLEYRSPQIGIVTVIKIYPI